MAKIIIFSGAGISAESGISTFRDSGGLWEEYKIEEVCQVGCLAKNREKTIEFYDKRRCKLKDVKPNKAHIEITKIKEKYNDEIAVITQNIDDLFEKAGCKDVIHLHGFLREIRCNKCNFIEDIGYKSLKEVYPNEKCPKCGKNLRPNVVFFGESAPEYKKLYKEFNNCEMLVVIGTSGNVINPDMFLEKGDVKYSILNNLESSEAINDKLYSKILYKPVTEAIDEIIKDIEKFLGEK